MIYQDPLEHKPYRKIFASMNRRINLLHGAVRSVKTILSLCRFFYYVAHEKPPGRLLVMGYTIETIRHNLCQVIPDILHSISGESYDVIKRDSFDYKQDLSGGHLFENELLFVGGKNADAISRLKGKTTSGGGYFDEPDTYAEGVFNFALSRVDGKGARNYATCNANSPYHPIKTNVIDRADELDYFVQHFALDDNIYLDDDYKSHLKAVYKGLFHKRYIEGLWVLAEGIIYDMFNHDTQIGNFQHWQFDNYVIGIDYGDNNPCTFGLYGYNEISSQHDIPDIYLIRRYWYDSTKTNRRKTNSEYAADFAKFVTPDIRGKLKGIYCDPSATSFITELRQAGWPVKLGNNDVYEGISFLSEVMSQNKFWIDKNCREDIEEIAGYIWDDKAQLKGKNEPLKNRDHSIDRTRYTIFTHFKKEQPISYQQIASRHGKIRQKGAW